MKYRGASYAFTSGRTSFFQYSTYAYHLSIANALAPRVNNGRDTYGLGSFESVEVTKKMTSARLRATASILCVVKRTSECPPTRWSGYSWTPWEEHVTPFGPSGQENKWTVAVREWRPWIYFWVIIIRIWILEFELSKIACFEFYRIRGFKKPRLWNVFKFEHQKICNFRSIPWATLARHTVEWRLFWYSFKQNQVDYLNLYSLTTFIPINLLRFYPM